MTRNGLSRHLRANLFFAGIITLSLLWMAGRSALSDDQLSYWVIAQRILSPDVSLIWKPFRTFAFLLAGLSKFFPHPAACFKCVYVLAALFYLNTMAWCLRYFFKDERIVLAVVWISFIPRYTLGLTYWGFMGFDYVLARILVMPLVPVILRLFVEWQKDRRRWAVLPLCALGGLLSFEAFILLVLLAGVEAVSLVRDAGSRTMRGPALAGLGLSFVLAAAIFFMPRIYDPQPAYVLRPVFENIIPANAGFMESLSPGAFADLYWNAARSAYWWGMFPPGAGDIGFALFHSMFLLALAVPGFIYFRGEHAQGFRFAVRFLVVGVLIAYGYQLARWVGWKLWGGWPDVWEEVRVFKFLFFPLFLAAGYALRAWFGSGRFWRGLLALMVLSLPMGDLLKFLPEHVKHQVKSAGSRWVHHPAYESYARKALGLRDAAGAGEEREIGRILSSLSAGGRGFVLSTSHRLKETGHHIVISYHDKHAGIIEFGGRTYQKLPYWYIAYEQVKAALDSCDPERILKTARKYGCRYVVPPCRLAHPGFKPLYEGSRYSLYELPPPAGKREPSRGI